jgi:hypothetical protein
LYQREKSSFVLLIGADVGGGIEAGTEEIGSTAVSGAIPLLELLSRELSVLVVLMMEALILTIFESSPIDIKS